MTKAREEKWFAVEDGSLVVDGRCHPMRFDQAKLAAAAPDMARLLLAREWEPHDECDPYCPSCHHSEPKHYDENESPRTPKPGEGHADDCAWVATMRKAGVLE